MTQPMWGADIKIHPLDIIGVGLVLMCRVLKCVDVCSIRTTPGFAAEAG